MNVTNNFTSTCIKKKKKIVIKKNTNICCVHHLICIIQYCIPVSLKHSMFTCSVGATYSSLCVVSSDNIYFWPLGGRSKLIVNVQKVVSVDQYFLFTNFFYCTYSSSAAF